MIKEITVYTDGDSAAISTWSNIPYLFTETLISKGIKVNRVDISPTGLAHQNRLWRIFYNRIFDKIIRKIHPATSFEYKRSWFHYINVRKTIQTTLKQYPQTDLLLFLTYCPAAADLTHKPILLFSDWTYEYYFKSFLHRKPDLFERQAIRRENRQIERAQWVVNLFPKTAEYMQKRYHNPNIVYLGNVVNAIMAPDETAILAQKQSSFKLLFVGKAKYRDSAQSLIAAFNLLKTRYPQLSLHIVGMIAEDFDVLPEGVSCYGYLDKNIAAERKTYYRLLQEAKLFVNPSPLWGAFSASLEAMYFYVPTVVCPYPEFVETFGKDIRSGIYLPSDRPEDIAQTMDTLLNSPDYLQCCKAAHQAAEPFSWEAYIGKLLQLIR